MFQKKYKKAIYILDIELIETTDFFLQNFQYPVKSDNDLTK